MNLLLVVFVITLLFSIIQTKKPLGKINTRIFGGKPAKRQNFAYQAKLFIFRNYGATAGFGCGGALISDRHVLSAAHCFYDYKTLMPYVKVTLGCIKKFSSYGDDCITMTSRNIYVHPGYTSLSSSDIAIVKLPQQVLFKAGLIEAIRLPARNQGSLIGKTDTTSGWGNINDRLQRSSNVLLYTDLMIIPDNMCKRKYSSFIPRLHICAQGKGTSTCQGDSGGPHVIKESDGIKTIVGVTSFGIQHCEDLAPEVMTSVHYHLDWIYRVTGIKQR